MRGLVAQLAIGAFLFLSIVATSSDAQNWPAKPVRLVSPFAPGGSSDTIGRLLAEQLSQKFGQQFYVENRAGAAGLIGTAAVANSEPDGYTFLISSVGTNVTVPATNPNAGFDPIRSFTHIGYLGGPPNVIVVHPSLGVKTFVQLAALAKRSGEPIPYVSPGPGTLGNLVAELWARKEGVRLAHVAYKGAGQAMNDLIAGHVQVGSLTWTAAIGQIRAGSVIPLAVSSADRMAGFPDVPSMKELGHPDLVATTWFGISGPAGIRNEIVERLHRAIADAVRTPALKTRFDLEGIVSEQMSPQRFAGFVGNELAKWGPIARQVINATADK